MIQRVENGVTYAQTFDIENRLSSVTVNGHKVEFVYDGDGSLVKKVVKDDGVNVTKTTRYIGGIYEVSISAAETKKTSYYPAGGAMRVEIVGGPITTYYLLKDHLGSASITLDSTGNLVPGGEQRYYPFGESRIDTATLPTDRLYTGQREIADFDIGLYHYNARFYSPGLGRFISPDTIIPGVANPQAFNRYTYVFNNPILYNDPTGHCPCAALLNPVPLLLIGLAIVAVIVMVKINAENPNMWAPVTAPVDSWVQEMGQKPDERDPPRNKPKLVPNQAERANSRPFA